MNKKLDRVLVLGACYGTGNMGVDALLSGTIASILRKDLDTEIVLIDFRREGGLFRVPNGQDEIMVRLENLRFSWRIWLRNNGFRLLFLAWLLRLLPLTAIRRWCMAMHPALETIGGGTLALSLAGGDSFSDIYGFRRLLYVCLPQFLVLAMDCPLVLLPQTLGPFKSGIARQMARFVMTHAMQVYARDQASLKVARDMLGPAAGHLAYTQDMAFALNPQAPANGVPDWATRKPRPLVGLNVSGLLFMGGYTRNNMFELVEDYPELMRKLIRWFIRGADADVVLVAHVTGHENDATACEALSRDLADECGGRLHLADPVYDHRQIKHLIGHCDFFLGARMHACIAALSLGIPAIGLAYSRKFAGVFESVDVPELVVDLRTQDAAEVLSNVIKLYNERRVFADRLKASAGHARHAAENLYSELTRPALSSGTETRMIEVLEHEPATS